VFCSCFIFLILLCILNHLYFNLARLMKVRNADKIIVLKDGRAFEEGTHDELLARNGLYAEMWNMQLHSTSTTTSQVNLLSPSDSEL
jgi:ABC-type bacteriocin/lantibiotic exporter with double-glycine peptidase domain